MCTPQITALFDGMAQQQQKQQKQKQQHE